MRVEKCSHGEETITREEGCSGWSVSNWPVGNKSASMFHRTITLLFHFMLAMLAACVSGNIKVTCPSAYFQACFNDVSYSSGRVSSCPFSVLRARPWVVWWSPAAERGVFVWLLSLNVNNLYSESLTGPLNSMIITQIGLSYSVHVCLYKCALTVREESIVAVD